MNKIERQLDRLARQFEREADKLIAEARQKYVIPFCDRTGLRFTAGMGSWSFDNGHGDYKNLPEELPKRLGDVLSAEYPLNRCNDVGSLMESYTPKNYKG